MTDHLAHPFQPGTRVAIRLHGLGDNENTYREAFVDRVHKSGRFLLCGSTQQYRPSESHGEWSACRTGDGRWDRETVIPWNEKNGAKIEGARAREALWNRACKIRVRVERWKRTDVTVEMLDAIEAALATVGGSS